jgi:hypothetical protein
VMTTNETATLNLLILFNIYNFLLCRIVVTNRSEANKFFITVVCQLCKILVTDFTRKSEQPFCN